MKHFKSIVLLITCFFPSWMWAKQVNQEIAQQVAETQANSGSQLRSSQGLNLVFVKTTVSNKTGSSPIKASSAPATVLYYVFNVGDKGFVIVSGDDVAKPVLGYSDEESYDPNKLSPEFTYFLDDCLAKEIEQAISQGIPQSEETKAQWEAYLNGDVSTLRASTSTVSPLIATRWNQDSPYNNLCPAVSGVPSSYNGHVPTGCVATAMAQIMKYWNYPTTGSGSYSYTSSYGSLSANFGATNYDWGNMTNLYSSSSSAQENSAVATLMYHSGVSVKMNYGPSESSAVAGDVVAALVNYFNYDSGLNYLERNYYSYTDWVNYIKTELDANRPVFYAGQETSGDGHAFICDGYDSNGLFHFNWGWAGMSDGYFELSALNPSSLGIGGGTGGFNVDQAIIVGIRPNAGGSANPQLGLSDLYSSSASLNPSTTPFGVVITNLSNIGSVTLNSLYLSVQLCKEDGTYIADLLPNYNLNNSIGSGFAPGYYFEGNITLPTYNLPSGLAPGTYKLYATFSQTNSPYTPIRIKGINGDKYITVVVASDNTVTLTKGSSVSPDLSLVSLATVGNLYQNRTGNFTVTVANNGNGDYNSQMSIEINGTVVETGPVVIPSGTTKDLNFSGTISLSPDIYPLTLWIDPNNNQSAPSVQLGSAQNVTVNATPADPALTLTSLSFPNANAVSLSEPNLTVKIKNTGGVFDGNILVGIALPNAGFTINEFGAPSVTIEGGEEKTILFNDLVNLPAGDYWAFIYSKNDNSNTYTQMLNTFQFPFTFTEPKVTWTGTADNNWNNQSNWNPGRVPNSSDTVIISKGATYFPVLQNNETVAEIHFEPGAQIGNQSMLTGKSFVQYDFSKRESWNMLSIPLGAVYPGDFAFGGYPQTWVQTFTASTSGSVTTGSWITIRGIDDPANPYKFTPGDGFIIWLNKDDHSGEPQDPNKGLKLLSNNYRELPFFFHHAAALGSAERMLYDSVQQAHDYDISTGLSTFYSVVNSGGQYVRSSSSYTVVRDASAYQLAGSEVSKTLDFAGDFALTGNPYMAPLDFTQLYENNSSIINGTYNIWTGAGYETYSASTGEASGIIGAVPQNGYIAPLQGFIVGKSGSASSGPLVFNQSMATVNPGIQLRSSASAGNKLTIDARNPVAGVRAIIAKQEGGQDELSDLDSRKIVNSISNVPEIYTLKPDKDGFSVGTGVNVIFNDNLLIPIGLSTSYTGDVKFSFSGMDTYDANLGFIDSEANKEIDLTGLDSFNYVVNYTPKIVNGKAAASEDRFFIRISKSATGLTYPTLGKVNVYESKGVIQVVSEASNPIKEVEIYNMQGSLMYKKSAINAISHKVNRTWATGVYIVKVISGKSVDNVKVVVK